MSSLLHFELLSVAHRALDAAAAETLKWFRSANLSSDNKDDLGWDPVTQGDRAAEATMRAVLGELRPDDAILGEEQDYTPGTSGLTWVLDPIDGTRGFVAGTPTWGTLISVGTDSGPEVGVIAQPHIGERFVGMPGRAELIDRDGVGRDIHVSTTTSLNEAIILTTFPEVGTSAEGRAFHSVAEHCRLTRYGMDCYGYALLAAGHVDLVIEAGLAPYDIQAPIAVVQAAGGIVTSWSGKPAHGGGQAVAAATPELHRAALRLLQEYAND